MKQRYSKKSKYGSRKVTKDGIVFDSVRECNRWTELKLLERAGHISGIQRQVKFQLLPSQKIDGKVVERPVFYVADFFYKDKDGNVVVEDTKGFKTKDYIIKRKLMLHVHGIRIKEI